ncbi:MAG: TIGR02206 family membrane protein [Polyangiaceae bacterium]
MRPPFVPFSTQHLHAVGVWLALTVVLIAAGRRLDERRRRVAARTLSVVLVVYYGVESVVRVGALGARMMDTLPFEMCSALFFVGAFGLWTGNLVALEVTWFWTLSGPIHALLTPTPRAGFPDPNFFQYFLAHGLLVFAALFVALVLRTAPRPGGVRRSFAALLVFVPVIGVVDLATGENYLYLRHKPPSPTLVDVLGPWPLYVGNGLIVALASFAVVNLPFVIARRRAGTGTARLPPGPRTPGFVQLARFATRPFAFFDACAARYGDIFTVDMATYGKFVMVASPDLVKQVLTADPGTLFGGSANRDLEPFVGPRSLLLLDGDEHLRHRRLVTPPFHGDRMRAYTRLMAEGTRAAIARMPTGQPFAIHPYTQAIALEVILRAVFGLTEGESKDRMASALVAYLEPPSPLLMFLPRVDLPLSPYRAFLRRRSAVDREIVALLAARRRGASGSGEDILSLLLATRDEAGLPMTDGEARDELMTLLIAGHETTATALAWAIERLVTHPGVLARAAAEVRDVDDPELLASCEYLEAVIKESLRMRPIFPDVVREAQVEWKLGDWTLPPKTRLAPCIHLAHHREASWPDARAFRPERFVGAKTDPYAWFPFGGGTRRCLGMAFALHEMKIVLGTMLRHAKLRPVASAVRPVRRGVTLAPERGCVVVLDETRVV